MAVKKSSRTKKSTSVPAEEMAFEPWKHALVPLQWKHALVPLHEKMTEKESKAVFEKYHLRMHELPKINSSDPALRNLNAKPGDLIKITRKSPTAGTTVFYRGVIDE